MTHKRAESATKWALLHLLLAALLVAAFAEPSTALPVAERAPRRNDNARGAAMPEEPEDRTSTAPRDANVDAGDVSPSLSPRAFDGVDGEEEGTWSKRIERRFGSFGKRVVRDVFWDGKRHGPTVDDQHRADHDATRRRSGRNLAQNSQERHRRQREARERLHALHRRRLNNRP